MLPDGAGDEDLTLAQKCERAIGHAISQVLGTEDSNFVIKWVAAVETIDGDGDRGIWTFTSSDAKRWDIYGMLAELDHWQVAQTVAKILREDL